MFEECIVKRPPSGIASMAFAAKFRSTSRKRTSIRANGCERRVQFDLQGDIFGEAGLHGPANFFDESVQIQTIPGRSSCCLLNADSCCVKAAPRSAAALISTSGMYAGSVSCRS